MIRQLPIVLLLLTAPSLHGHAGIHERIADITKRIRNDPENADLYLKRGELHRVHRDWERALADYRQAAGLEPQMSEVFLLRGRMQYEAGHLEAAKTDLDRFLQLQPRHHEALLTRARVLVRLGRGLEAAEDYTRAIAQHPDAGPEYFLERAEALVAVGGKSVDRAVEGLDEGIARLGPLVTLQTYAIELELERRRHDEALQRLTAIRRWLPAERYFCRRGEILRQAGRHNGAFEAFEEALRQIERIPPPRRNAKPTRALEAQLRSALERESSQAASPR